MHSFKGRRQSKIIATLIGVAVILFLADTGLKAYAQAQKKIEEKKEQESFSRPAPTRPIKPEIPSANRYRQDKVFLEYADSLYKVRSRDTVERQILKGNVKFRQSGMWMFCDSAYYYPNLNSLDAFSNVRMEQGDTLFVYADKLFYNGDIRMAYLKNGPTQKKVVLINNDVTLTTDSLDYDLGIDLGWYSKWGTIDDKVNVLTSLYGEYSPKTKQADFYHDVVLVNNRDGFRMLTDTLHYNTATHIADIETKTEIQSDNDTIITNNAVYYTDSGNADLLSRSLIIHKDSTGNIITLEGDSIIYDNATRISRAYMYRDPEKKSSPMVLTDTAQRMTLIGGYGIYNDSTREALATIYPLLMEYSQGDTLFLRADTIKTFIITEMIPVKKRRWTKSGFPEFNEIPIIKKDSLTGSLWIDTVYFRVSAPMEELPVKMINSEIPEDAPVFFFNKNEEQEDSLSDIQIEMDIDQLRDSLSDDERIHDLISDTITAGLIGKEISPDSIGKEIEINLENTDVLEKSKVLEISADSIMTEYISGRVINEEHNNFTIPILQAENDTVEIFNDSIVFENTNILDIPLDSVFADSIKFQQSVSDSLLMDSLILRDSVLQSIDSLIDKEGIDTVPKIPKDYHVALAYHRARFFKKDMQGIADSMVFVERDSMLYMFRKPIIWSGERQVTGNRIDVHFNDSTADWAYLPESGLMAEYIDEDFYNQITGKEIRAFFEDQTLKRMSVSGSVETIFLPQENDSTFNRIINAESSYLELSLKDNKMEWLKMWPEVSGSVTPIFMVKKNQKYLQRFKWWGFLRPEREWYGDQLRWADNLGEVPDELEQYFLAPSDFGEPKSFTGPRVRIPITSLTDWDEIPAIDSTDSLQIDSGDLKHLQDSVSVNMPDSISIIEKELSSEDEDLTLEDVEKESEDLNDEEREVVTQSGEIEAIEEKEQQNIPENEEEKLKDPENDSSENMEPTKTEIVNSEE